MGDENTNQKKRKSKWTTSYSNMTAVQADKRLGFRIPSLKAISVDELLANAKYGPDAWLTTKMKVYDQIVQYLRVEGYPTETDPDFKEASINDLVYATISPILDDFIRMTGRESIRLRREKEIVSEDGETGGTEEFVIVDLISLEEEKFILVVEAKRSSLGQAMRQCLVAMKDMGDLNKCGVYGFVTIGKQWQMIHYDGTSFVATEEFAVMFQTMETNKKRWMKDFSIVVDCMYFALSNGGIVKDMVVGS